MTPNCPPFGARRFYSYGDSAGFSPDFPFNPDVYRQETKSAANVMELWEEQKNVLFTMVGLIKMKGNSSEEISSRCGIVVTTTGRINVVTQTVCYVKEIFTAYKNVKLRLS